MKEFDIFSDSACDLTTELIKKHEINIVPFKISFDRVKKLADGIDISTDEFYLRLEATSSIPKTYFPTVRNYVDGFKKSLEKGQNVLCICMSSKLSKSYYSAINAKDILSHIYKNNKIMVIDSLSATGIQALLTMDAVKLRAKMDIDATYRKLEEIRKSALIVFTVSSLEQLAKGGRLSRSSAAIGKLLGINPIIYLENGILTSKNKALGRHKAVNKIKELSIAEMGVNLKNYDFCVLYAAELPEAITLGREMESLCGIKQIIPPLRVGMTIGMHTGSSVIAVAMLKKI